MHRPSCTGPQALTESTKGADKGFKTAPMGPNGFKGCGYDFSKKVWKRRAGGRGKWGVGWRDGGREVSSAWR